MIIEVEKEATQSVFYFLKEAKYFVFIDSTIDLFEKYLPIEKELSIVRSLVSEAPLRNIKGITTASLEKMLVDVFCNDVIFSPQQVAGMRTLFKDALNKYSVNENRMLRYTERRREKENLINYLNSIINLQ